MDIFLIVLLFIGAGIPIFVTFYKDKRANDRRLADKDSIIHHISEIRKLQHDLDALDAARQLESQEFQHRYDSLNAERIAQVNELQLKHKNDIMARQLQLASGELSDPYVVFGSYNPGKKLGSVKFGNKNGKTAVENMKGTIRVYSDSVIFEPPYEINFGPFSIPTGGHAAEVFYFPMEQPEGKHLHLGVKFSCNKGHFRQEIVVEKNMNGNYVQAYELVDVTGREMKFTRWFDPTFPLDKTEATKNWSKQPTSWSNE